MIGLAARMDGLVALWFFGQRHAPDASGWLDNSDQPDIRAAIDWLDEYFAGGNPSYTGRLILEGTAFRRAVWSRLLRVGHGETTTYGALRDELAGVLGRPMSARAVGGAVGHNPISLIVPCHRVVGAGGALTGYGGGLDRKRALLRMEGGPAVR
ncbi:MAG: methylated-DNA--[protein]-cysteine S-methyltransferase [Bifidobacteriaceae bacterium]|nr:methylated-DNA--[protein]-cysteine S-methyltransferase [Bifidobacteriaceae bacterium]